MIKVASYCRVSTDKDDQANSFEAQQRFFREYISRQPDWELFDVYADEGMTGTSTKKRVQFNRMIDDAYQGEFKLIITKEVSRFSRNILDTIRFTRELKALGIAVLFMTDGINTMDADAELKLSLMASIAQEESRRTSARVKWGQTRQMERGVVFGRSMLGYDVKDGKMTINPKGAEIVRLIFQKYGIEKKGTSVIARELQEAGHKTLSGKAEWSNSHIVKILKNEKYVGDLVQKKTITPDFLTHAKKNNHGEEEMVRIENHHAPIVSRKLWNLVQTEMAVRNRHNGTERGHSNRYVFSGKITCAECGATFVSRTKTRKSGSSYKYWRCSRAANQGSARLDSQGNMVGCSVGKQLREELAMNILIQSIRSLPMDSERIIRELTDMVSASIYTESAKTNQPKTIQNEIKMLEQKKAALLDTYFSEDITREEMLSQKNRYDSEIKVLQAKLASILEKPPAELGRQQLRSQIESIVCGTYHDAFFKGILNQMIVHKNGRVEVTLQKLPHTWIFQIKEQTNH